MREELAQTVLLVRAFEEADPEGRVLTREQRAIATRRAVTVTGAHSPDPDRPYTEETVVRRARVLREVLTRKIPALRRVTELARLHSLMGPAFFAGALLVGVSTNLFGPHNRINLLSYAFLGLLAWNIGSYVLMAALAVLRPRLSRRTGDGAPVDLLAQERLVHGLAGLVVRLALWRSKFALKRAQDRPDDARVASRAFRRFCALWHRATGELLEARVRRRLHLAAIAMVLGVVGGMYLRGIAVEYRATWESTWFDAAQVQAFLDRLFLPASMVSGVDVPEVAPLHAPASGPAGPWLHLYAATAFLFVVLPRLVMAVYEAWRGASLKRDLPVDFGEAYFRRILADWRGEARQIEVVPYSFNPSPRTIGHLKTMLHDFFGTRADIQVREPVSYGEESVGVSDPFREPADDGHSARRYAVVLFNLAQTPEAEVHGEFLQRLKDTVDPRVRLLVLIDVSSYRVRGSEAQRRRERLAAWERVTQSAGLKSVDLDPDRSAADMGFADTRLAAVREALWSAAEALEAG